MITTYECRVLPRYTPGPWQLQAATEKADRLARIVTMPHYRLIIANAYWAWKDERTKRTAMVNEKTLDHMWAIEGLITLPQVDPDDILVYSDGFRVYDGDLIKSLKAIDARLLELGWDLPPTDYSKLELPYPRIFG